MSQLIPPHEPQGTTSPPAHDPAQPSIQHVGDSVTTGTLPIVVPTSQSPQANRRPVKEPVGLWMGVLGVIAVLGGIPAGFLWKLLVPLTQYVVTPDSWVETTERGLAAYVAGDAWFTAIGMVVGLGIGYLVWRWFAGLGWPVVFIAAFAALVMGLATWQFGWWLGPNGFNERMGQAPPGAQVPIDLTLRAHVALLAWPFGAVLPIMLASSLLRDPEEGTARVPVK